MTLLVALTALEAWILVMPGAVVVVAINKIVVCGFCYDGGGTSSSGGSGDYSSSNSECHSGEDSCYSIKGPTTVCSLYIEP